MAEQKAPPFNLKQALELIIQTSELSVKSAGLNKGIVDELMRLRGWETMLYLLFTRYYLSKEGPRKLAESDRDLLANNWRTHGQSEETAAHVENIYQTIFTLMENYSRAAGSGQSAEESEDERVM
jgi:hypothetical protein